jgi:hypothetical protein
MGGDVRGLLAVWFDVSAEFDEEFNEWYNQEHVPQREVIPGILSARRFVAVQGSPRYFAVYDLESAAVLQGAAYQGIVGEHESPWSRRVRRKATLLVRSVYEQISSLSVSVPEASASDLPKSQSGHGLLVVGAEVSPEQASEFDHWYDQQRLPERMAIPGIRSARRFRALEGRPAWLALHEVDSISTLPDQLCKSIIEEARPAEAIESLPWPGLQCALYTQIYPPVE